MYGVAYRHLPSPFFTRHFPPFLFLRWRREREEELCGWGSLSPRPEETQFRRRHCTGVSCEVVCYGQLVPYPGESVDVLFFFSRFLHIVPGGRTYVSSSGAVMKNTPARPRLRVTATKRKRPSVFENSVRKLQQREIGCFRSVGSSLSNAQEKFRNFQLQVGNLTLRFLLSYVDFFFWIYLALTMCCDASSEKPGIRVFAALSAYVFFRFLMKTRDLSFL